MYHYVEDKKLLSWIKAAGGDILQHTCHILKKQFEIGANFYLVGSGKRKLITQNANGPIDLDYNLRIVRCDDFDDCRWLKECVRKAFNQAAQSRRQHDGKDSRAVLTSELLDVRKISLDSSRVPRCSIDICIVMEEGGDTYRLIHKKTGCSAADEYYWNKAPSSKVVRKKADCIKKWGAWHLVREAYLDIKNQYLCRNDHNHPSFVCYAEAVHRVYNAERQRQRRG